MISKMPMAPRLTRQPLTANIKLQAINKFRVASRSSQVNSVGPAQITLSPAVPSVGGQNYLLLRGIYTAPSGSPQMFMQGSTASIFFCFATVAGKTYLLDFQFHGTQNWGYSLQQGMGAMSARLPITAQQNHLLIPFVAADVTICLCLFPLTGWETQFGSAELTRVD
jgi:hypothetical protein